MFKQKKKKNKKKVRGERKKKITAFCLNAGASWMRIHTRPKWEVGPSFLSSPPDFTESGSGEKFLVCFPEEMKFMQSQSSLFLTHKPVWTKFDRHAESVSVEYQSPAVCMKRAVWIAGCCKKEKLHLFTGTGTCLSSEKSYQKSCVFSRAKALGLGSGGSQSFSSSRLTAAGRVERLSLGSRAFPKPRAKTK